MFYGFRNHIEGREICFFPGKFIDEAFRLLRLVQREKPLGQKFYDLVTELRDLETMAKNHHDKVLKPRLPRPEAPLPSRIEKIDQSFVMEFNKAITKTIDEAVTEALAKPQDRIHALEKEVRSLKGKNTRLQNRLRNLEKRFNELRGPDKIAADPKPGKIRKASKRQPQSAPDTAPTRSNPTASTSSRPGIVPGTLKLTRSSDLLEPVDVKGDTEPAAKKPRNA